MSAIEDLRKAISAIIDGPEPSATMAVVSPEVEPSSFTAWVVPSEDLKNIYWISSPQRRHSQIITIWEERGETAELSGGMHLPQRPSRPVSGVFFNGEASRLTEQSEIEESGEILLRHRVFFPDEVEDYLGPSEGSGNAPHQFYVARMKEYTLFDGTHPQHDKRTRRIKVPFEEEE